LGGCKICLIDCGYRKKIKISTESKQVINNVAEECKKNIAKKKMAQPGLNHINKNFQILEIFRKSQKILYLPFLLERPEKLSSWCFGSASLLKV
jgi:hypothetical protein